MLDAIPKWPDLLLLLSSPTPQVHLQWKCIKIILVKKYKNEIKDVWLRHQMISPGLVAASEETIVHLWSLIMMTILNFRFLLQTTVHDDKLS